jgi:hypothetical protein
MTTYTFFRPFLNHADIILYVSKGSELKPPISTFLGNSNFLKRMVSGDRNKLIVVRPLDADPKTSTIEKDKRQAAELDSFKKIQESLVDLVYQALKAIYPQKNFKECFLIAEKTLQKAEYDDKMNFTNSIFVLHTWSRSQNYVTDCTQRLEKLDSLFTLKYIGGERMSQLGTCLKDEIIVPFSNDLQVVRIIPQ